MPFLICVGSLVVIRFVPFGGSFVGGFSPSTGVLVFTAPTNLVCDQWQGKAKWVKAVGEYSMGFKVPTSREEIGDPLDKYSINHDISPTSHFL